MIQNLNDLRISDECRGEPLADHETASYAPRVRVFFRQIEHHLLRDIRRADAVVGCVAWLTSDIILKSLATVQHGVSIVVQKEDFLRPDLGARGGWKAELRRLYGRLPQLPERHFLGGLVGSLSFCKDPSIDAIRCVGNHNRTKSPAFPRMHNKFLVFCELLEFEDRDGADAAGLRPRSVWTGSFNMTKNASMSLENVVVIDDPKIAGAYLGEWEQILALSEPLDWTTDWSEPEWRIGS